MQNFPSDYGGVLHDIRHRFAALSKMTTDITRFAKNNFLKPETFSRFREMCQTCPRFFGRDIAFKIAHREQVKIMTIEKTTTGSGSMELAVNCIKNGAFDFLSNYFTMFTLRDAEERYGKIYPVQFIHSSI
jgi:hypothetical protein